ncbi:MAG: ISAs1 family transposase [Ktedonobacterales bacterium]
MREDECSTWIEMLQTVPDPRAARGCRYPWTALLTLICAALVSEQQSAEAMAQWIAEHAAEWQSWVWTPRGGVPSAATIRRALCHVNVQALEARLGAWTQACMATDVAATGVADAVRGVAVDGKAVRGAQAHGAQVHLVSLVTQQQAQVLGQVAVAEKRNEIPAVRELLRGRDLTGWLVTLDAMHTQRETADLILAQGGHYLMVVKGNQPDLHTALAEWFAEDAWAEEQEARVTTCDVGHGRHEHRTLIRRRVDTHLLGWPGAQQALQRSTWAQVLPQGVERHEVTYAVTSLPPNRYPPAALEAAWRGHWGIENQVHYVRDVTLGEDAGQAHLGSTPQALAALRNGLLSLLRRQGYTRIAHTLRHLGASVARALRFLGCSPLTLDRRL